MRQQEEVQRLGREGCPGKIEARMQFYTLVSLRTFEKDFAQCVAWMKRSEIQETPGFRPDGLHPGYGVFVQLLTLQQLTIGANKLIRGQGIAIEITLGLVTALLLQENRLFPGFNALGDDFQSQIVR